MPTRHLYRDGQLLSGDALNLTVSKTLGSSGEHDLWSGSGGLPQPNGTPISVSSSSAQDAETITDSWTISEAEGGIDYAQSVEIDGVLHGAVGIGGGLSALEAAVNEGSRATYAIFITTLPAASEFIIVSVGGTDYLAQRTTEATADELATTVAAAMSADPDYDAVAAGGDSGAVLLTAKTPNTAKPAVTVGFPVSGSGGAQQLVAHGPASAVMTAEAVGDDLVLTAVEAGVAYVVTAESDRVTATHTTTGGAGSGVRSVAVRYLDTNGAQVTEVLALNGLNPVSTAGEATVLLDVRATEVGSAGAAVGTITVADTAESPTTLATIAIGDSETHRLSWVVGTGRRLYVTGVSATNLSGTPGHLRLRVSGPSGARIAFAGLVPAYSASVTIADLTNAPLVLSAGESIKATLENNGSICFVTLLGYEEG